MVEKDETKVDERVSVRWFERTKILVRSFKFKSDGRRFDGESGGRNGPV